MWSLRVKLWQGQKRLFLVKISERAAMAFQAFIADSMRGACLKSARHELLPVHPFLFHPDAMAPGTDPQIFLELRYSREQSLGCSGDNQPDREHEEHFERGFAEVRNVRIVPENERSQSDYFIKPGKRDDGEKAKALAEQNITKLHVSSVAREFMGIVSNEVSRTSFSPLRIQAA